MISISAHLDDEERRNESEALLKIKLCSGFLIRKMLCKVRICLEYRVMPQIFRNVYQQMSEFDRDRIVACLE